MRTERSPGAQSIAHGFGQTIAESDRAGHHGSVQTPEELERVIAEQNRSATFGLLERLAETSTPEEEREQVVYALAQLADPRAVRPLVELAENVTLDMTVRGSALDALAEAGLCPEGDDLRRWWASGDEELRKQVLIEAERTEADIVGPVAGDPSHPLYAQAIWGIEYSFEEPEWQECKIRALSHPDPAVRRAAAVTLMWDEPIRAEHGLHQVASDAEDDVAMAAIDTLKYYRSRSTLRLLHEIARTGSEERAAVAQASLDDMCGYFRSALLAGGAVRERLRRWMDPVWHILRFEEEPEPVDQTSWPEPEPKLAVPAAQWMIEAYADLDGPWAERLRRLQRYDWAGVPPTDREALSRFFVAHPDPAVRDGVGGAFAEWNDTEHLLELAHDPVSWVRKSAIYHLQFVLHSGEIARLAWDLLAGGEVAGTRGREALRTYVAHSPAGEVTAHLIELAQNDLRETLRYEAVDILDTESQAVLTLLTEPPLVTWGVHTMLLATASTHHMAIPSVAHLHDVDNLDLVEALVQFEEDSA